jgi:hypothetical protein
VQWLISYSSLTSGPKHLSLVEHLVKQYAASKGEAHSSPLANYCSSPPLLCKRGTGCSYVSSAHNVWSCRRLRRNTSRVVPATFARSFQDLTRASILNFNSIFDLVCIHVYAKGRCLVPHLYQATLHLARHTAGTLPCRDACCQSLINNDHRPRPPTSLQYCTEYPYLVLLCAKHP